jgi:hypothetical protein
MLANVYITVLQYKIPYILIGIAYFGCGISTNIPHKRDIERGGARIVLKHTKKIV